MVHLGLVTLIVGDYDSAIEFFVGVLGFELVEDSPATTEGGQSKRWVRVRPPGAETGLLLARADGAEQRERVGDQTAGRVGFFFQVEDFDAVLHRLRAHGMHIIREPRDEPYGRVAVFKDVAGNHWDLIASASNDDDRARDP